MKADLLRRAATKAREVAEIATSGPWFGVTGPGGYPIEVRTGKNSKSGIPVLFNPDHLIGAAHYMRGQDAHHIALWNPAVALAVADWLDSVAETHQAEVEQVELMLHYDEECPTGECVDGDGHLSVVCRGCFPTWDGMQGHTLWPCLEYKRAEPVARLLLNEVAP